MGMVFWDLIPQWLFVVPRRRVAGPPPSFTPSPRQARPLLHGIRVTVDVARGMPPQAKPLALAKGGGRDNP